MGHFDFRPPLYFTRLSWPCNCTILQYILHESFKQMIWMGWDIYTISIKLEILVFYSQKFFNFRFETLQNKIWNTFTSLSGTRRPLCYPRLWNQPTEHVVALWKLPQAVFSTLAVLPWYQLIPWLTISPTLPYSSLQSTCLLKNGNGPWRNAPSTMKKLTFPILVVPHFGISGQGLIPAFIGRPLSDTERQILSLPARYGGVGIPNPIKTSDRRIWGFQLCHWRPCNVDSQPASRPFSPW